MIKKDAFTASFDLKDAFYSAPVTEHHQRYLKLFANEYAKWVWSGHENLYKDQISTIFSAQDAGSYLYM